MPDLELICTNDSAINFSKIQGRFVIYCYPMTGVPGKME